MRSLTIDAAVHLAVRDVCFLIKLHHQVNRYLMAEEKVRGVMFAALEGNIRAITRENRCQRLLRDLVHKCSCEIPCPLDVENAGTLQADAS